MEGKIPKLTTSQNPENVATRRNKCHTHNNLLLVIMIIVWVAPTMGAVFFGVKMAGLARVAPGVEVIGLDISKHGVAPRLSASGDVKSVRPSGTPETTTPGASPAKSYTSEPSAIVDI